jgi:dipeptidyl aminopeptidase/acylaminoacyl peptidase
LLALALASPLLAQRTFDVNALLGLSRVGDPQVSPNGQTVAFTVQTVDLAANRKSTQIYTVPLAGGTPTRITDAGIVNERPRWSPDGSLLAFVSDRSGSEQIWMMAASGANLRQVTSLSTGASGVLFSPDGKNLVFTSDVFPECTGDACNKQKLDAERASKVQARTYDSLLYRHWTHWQSKQRTHLFSVPPEGGVPKDLTPGDRDTPPFSLGGADDYAISPDGSEVCFVRISDPEPATSTNSDLYVVPIGGGEVRKITNNPGADSGPAYSPDGKYLAWRSQTRPGYESDRWRLMVLERASGRLNSVTESVDRWVTGFTWSPDSARLFYTLDDRGHQPIHMVATAGGGEREIVAGDSIMDDVHVTPDGKTLVFTQQSGSRPAEIFRAHSGGAAIALTHFNEAALAPYALPRLEGFWTEGADGVRVHSFLVKPHGFVEGRRYPVLFLIHGGPQGAWGEDWGYRWNPQVFAAAGFVVVMPNVRGSSGYGQKFIDEINADWGGKAFDDVMAVADHVAKLPYADPDKMAAAGGSYGGYMVDWLLGHTQRFKALVSHAGVYDLRSMFGETEELWFPLWEFRGTPWNNTELYTKLSPSTYVKDFATPTLAICGELDFRVPFGQSLQMFTALQTQKVPSRLLVFPDEGHWVLKPQNSVLWYNTVLDWVKQWTAKPWTPPAPPAAAEPAPAPAKP